MISLRVTSASLLLVASAASLRAQALVDVPVTPAGNSNFQYTQSVNVSGSLTGNVQYGLRVAGVGADGADTSGSNGGAGQSSGSIAKFTNSAAVNLSANQKPSGDRDSGRVAGGCRGQSDRR